LLRIERHEHFLSRFQSGNYHVLSSYEPPFGARVPHEHALRGDIATAKIFAQKESDAGIKRAFVKPVQ
jgi:hypothetical protein